MSSHPRECARSTYAKKYVTASSTFVQSLPCQSRHVPTEISNSFAWWTVYWPNNQSGSVKKPIGDCGFSPSKVLQPFFSWYCNSQEGLFSINLRETKQGRPIAVCLHAPPRLLSSPLLSCPLLSSPLLFVASFVVVKVSSNVIEDGRNS